MNRFLLAMTATIMFAMGLVACNHNNSTELAETQDVEDVEQPAQTPAEPEFAEGTAGAALTGYTKIIVTRTDWTDDPINKKVSEGEITDAEVMKQVFDLIEPHQELTRMSATCMFSHTLEFMGKDGNLVGRVGICIGNEFRPSHPAALVKIDANDKLISRLGMNIHNAKELAELIQNNLAQ